MEGISESETAKQLMMVGERKTSSVEDQDAFGPFSKQLVQSMHQYGPFNEHFFCSFHCIQTQPGIDRKDWSAKAPHVDQVGNWVTNSDIPKGFPQGVISKFKGGHAALLNDIMAFKVQIGSMEYKDTTFFLVLPLEDKANIYTKGRMWTPYGRKGEHKGRENVLLVGDVLFFGCDTSHCTGFPLDNPTKTATRIHLSFGKSMAKIDQSIYYLEQDSDEDEDDKKEQATWRHPSILGRSSKKARMHHAAPCSGANLKAEQSEDDSKPAAVETLRNVGESNNLGKEDQGVHSGVH